MVVFTCNNCGDSVKKPKVDKHISVECKRKRCGNVSLCCIDCLKDFNAQTYVEHTKCVSEEERYSAPGFVPKPSSNKGERKQCSWLDVVRSALNNSNLSKPQRSLLMIISNYENVPRKKSKFLNFIKNSANFRNTSYQVVEQVYDLLETEFKAASSQKASVNVDTLTNPDTVVEVDAKNFEVSDLNDKSININGNAAADENHEILTEKSNKKKKRKHEDDSLPTDADQHLDEKKLHNECETIPVKDDSFIVVKSKKKKKHKNNPAEDANFNNHIEADSGQNCQPLDLKTIHSSEKSDNVNSNDISNNYNMEIEDDLFLKKDKRKKRKDKNKPMDELSTSENIEAGVTVNSEHEIPESNGILIGQENYDVLEKKKKKKKRKLEVDTDNEINSKRSRIEELENCDNENQSKKFSWEKVVKTLLEKSKDREMSVKKMTKKVVAEYQSTCASNKSFEEIAKKFNKKVKKLPFVVVLKDRIQLYVE